MQLPRHVASALGVLLVAGLVPGTATAARPSRRRSSRVQRAAASCTAEGGTGAVRAPKLVRQIATGETGWFSSPGLVDLDGDGRLEIVAPFYSTFVFDANGPAAGPGHGERGPGLSAVGGHRPRGRRRRRHRGRAATRAPWRRTSSEAAGCSVKAGWPASTEQRRPVPGGPRARRRGPGRRRPGRGRGDDDQHLAHGRTGLRVRRQRRGCSSRRAVTPRRGPATTGSPGRATT